MKLPKSQIRRGSRWPGAVSLLFLLAACPAPAATLCGHVHDALSGKPVAGAEVRVYRPDGAYAGWHAPTDANGDWCLQNVPGGTYHLEVRANGYRLGILRDVVVTDTASGVDIAIQASAAAIEAPWPNPAQGRVNFRLRLGASGAALLGVYDVAGRCVRAWADADAGAGERTLVWDFLDDSGREVPAGRYYLRLEAGGVVATQPFMCVR
jgi:5-hydroxyisourate hydrolase-like protein (transthyretin family)